MIGGGSVANFPRLPVTFTDKLQLWWGLGLWYKWELLGVWVGLRCSACGEWLWKEPCWADRHWNQDGG